MVSANDKGPAKVCTVDFELQTRCIQALLAALPDYLGECLSALVNPGFDLFFE
ncbi:MAG: hypothetical protein WBW33_23385 [Bryobacteraceae bacterium]